MALLGKIDRLLLLPQTTSCDFLRSLMFSIIRFTSKKYYVTFSRKGKGYATEAVNAVIEEGFTKKGAHRIFANCNPENAPSWKLLERIGFRREGHLRKNVYFACAQDGTPLWQDTFL